MTRTDLTTDSPHTDSPRTESPRTDPSSRAAPTEPAPAGEGVEHVETVVLGAGQAGLATAYHLARLGRTCLVLDEHPRVGDQWRRRYASLRLNTPARYDGLPGLPFPGDGARFPTAGEFADHLERYAEQLALRVRPGTHVTGVDRAADGRYLVTSSTGVLCADNVVVATGGEHLPRVPSFAGELDKGIMQLHSSAYRGPGQLQPGPVLVVGAGQSGADLALEAATSGHETWLSGRVSGEAPFAVESARGRVALPVLWFAANHVLTERTPVGRRLRTRVRHGGTPLVRVRRRDLAAAGVHHVEGRTLGSRDGLPLLEDGRVLPVRNVLWCTGFRQDFGFLHPAVTGEDGWPLDDGGIVRTSPGLYFVGLLFQRGFYSMLIGGVGRDAERVARHLAVRSRRRAREAVLAG